MSVLVEAIDPDGEVVSVVVEWDSGVGTTTTTALTPTAGAPVWAGRIGLWVSPGTKIATIVVTDDGGASTTEALMVEATACPIGGITLG